MAYGPRVPEYLLKEMECPVCRDYMVPPILMCKNGHNVCSKCRGRIRLCPTCRDNFIVTRNVALENIVRQQEFPCGNKERGCTALFSIENIAEHNDVCGYAKTKCPLRLINCCSWEGHKNNFKEHVQEVHGEYIVYNPTFHCQVLSRNVMFVSHFGELFTYHKRRKDGIYYCPVQLFGTSSEAAKYECEFKLMAANGKDGISSKFSVSSYSEDFETIFNSGMCLRLDGKTAQKFLVERDLNLTITLSKL